MDGDRAREALMVRGQAAPRLYARFRPSRPALAPPAAMRGTGACSPPHDIREEAAPSSSSSAGSRLPHSYSPAQRVRLLAHNSPVYSPLVVRGEMLQLARLPPFA
ncbi:unnamed protein product [Arctogadus glacialis]